MTLKDLARGRPTIYDMMVLIIIQIFPKILKVSSYDAKKFGQGRPTINHMMVLIIIQIFPKIPKKLI